MPSKSLCKSTVFSFMMCIVFQLEVKLLTWESKHITCASADTAQENRSKLCNASAVITISLPTHSNLPIMFWITFYKLDPGYRINVVTEHRKHIVNKYEAYIR